MIRAHAAAVNALLTGVVNLVDYDQDAAPKAVAPFVVARTSGSRSRSGLAATSDEFTSTTTLLAYGKDRNQAQWVMEKAIGALLDVRPAIANRSCSPIEQIYDGGLHRDDEFTPSLQYATAQLRFISVPA